MKNTHWLRFGLYLIVAVLINWVSTTAQPIRIDLTKNRIYTLSNLSKKTVLSLKEPLTIKVFISENLPYPYNNLERQVRDLMEEYAIKGNRNFNYSIFSIDKEQLNTDKQGNNLAQLAIDYGISPINIQSLESNERSTVSGYMGMAVTQGDLSETINTLGEEINLEYSITQIMKKLASKSSALYSMEESIQAKFIFSKELLVKFPQYPGMVEELVDTVGKEFYDRIEYSYIDPLQEPVFVQESGLDPYDLGEIGSVIYAGLVIEGDQKNTAIPLLQRDFFGRTSLSQPADLEDDVKEVVELLLDIQENIGFLTDHGAPALFSSPYLPQQGPSIGNLYSLLSNSYQVDPVTLDSLPKGLKTLVIAGVTEEFSDWELFQIDQHLMRGGSLAFFIDSYKEILPQGQAAYFTPPSYELVNSRLKDLLLHYGIDIADNYVLDEQSYIDLRRAQNGGIQETPIYHVPIIQKENINQNSSITRNLKDIPLIGVASVSFAEEALDQRNQEILLSSSEAAWEMTGEINLNPGMVYPPMKDKQQQFDIALYSEGSFSSFFTGKTIPSAPIDKEAGDSREEAGFFIETEARGTEEYLTEGQGKVFVIASSQVLQDNIIDREGRGSTAIFVQNIIDVLSDRDDEAAMRSKGQSYEPLKDMSSAFKNAVKYINILGLPVLIVLGGLVMWFRLNRRQRKIKDIFQD